MDTHPYQDEVLHAEEPEERSTILTRIASERPNPLADLDSLLPVSHTFKDDTGFMTLCNDFLVLNAQEHSDPSVRSINIPGSKVFISPHQFYHAYHLLSQRGRDLNGGLLADDAGVGKTYVFFAACLFRALAYESARAVKLHWTGRDRRKRGRHGDQHLPEGANGRSCPSQKPGQIVCYCVPGSLTRLLCNSTPRGVSTLYCATETWPDILAMVQGAALNPSIYQLCLVHNNAPMRFTRPLQPLVKTLSRGVDPDPRDFSPASYIFISTLDSPRLWNAFSETGLNAGFMVIDEAHQVVRKSLTFRMAAEFSGNGADVWFVTATPFSRCTLSDWIPPMNLIAPSRAAAMVGLVKTLEAARSSGVADDVQRFREQFRAVFDDKLVVRHFGTSSFFGKPIADVQDIVPRVIPRETPLQHRAAVQELANQIKAKDPQLLDPAQRGLLYFVSLFPAAAELILEDPITFDMEAIRDNVRQVKNRLRIEDSEPLRRLTDQIVEESPKLDYILEELDRMGQDRRERKPSTHRSSSKFGAGEDLQMKKMVIITPTAVSAVFVYLALIRRRKDVALIHNWVSSQEKEQVVNNFMSLSAAKLVKHTRVLIAPFAVAGTGVNLQAASYQILTSPLPDRASQRQAFARTNRSGQRLDSLSHKILVLEDNPADRIILANHATLEIESDPFQINEPLRIAGHMPLDNMVNPIGVVENDSPSSHSSSLGVNDGLVLQDAISFTPGFTAVENGQRTERQDAGEDRKSIPSAMSADEVLLLQDAISFFPGFTAVENDQRTERQNADNDRTSVSSATNADEVLLLQDAMFFAPGFTAAENGQGTEGPEEDGLAELYDLFNGSAVTTMEGRQDDAEGSVKERSSPSSSQWNLTDDHWNLTYTPAPQHPLTSGAKELGHRPLPPLPDGSDSPGRSLGPRCRFPSLHPPLEFGPPLRIDAGPSLASRRAASMPAAPPRYKVDVDRDNLEIHVRDSATFSWDGGPNGSSAPLTVRLPIDFSLSESNITATVDRLRRRNRPSRPARTFSAPGSDYDPPSLAGDGDDIPHHRPGYFPLNMIERVPGPRPGQRREYGDDIPESDLNVANRLLPLRDLSRAAQSTARLIDGLRLGEDTEDARGQAENGNGKALRDPEDR